MKWLKDGPTAIKREDGAYRIFRAPQEGFVAEGGTVILALVSCHAHKIVDGRRNVENTPRALDEAYDALKEKAGA